MSIFSQAFDPATDTALVTGAGNGIGRAIALALVGEGVRTVFADIKQETVASTLKAAADAGADPKLAIGWVGDLAERSECERLMRDARASLGVVRRFVHSAAPPRHEADHALAVSDETWVRMRAVNVDAGFYLGREVAKDGWVFEDYLRRDWDLHALAAGSYVLRVSAGNGRMWMLKVLKK